MLDTITRAVRDVDERLPIVTVATARSPRQWFRDVALSSRRRGVLGVRRHRAAWRCSASTASSRTSSRGARASSAFESRSAHSHAPGATVLREGGRQPPSASIGRWALLAGQFLQGFLAGVNAAEPLVLVIAPLILLGASLLASSIPAPRATRVDPTVALRSE